MNTTWLTNYLNTINQVIPKYCYVTFKQDEGTLGKDTTNYLILAAQEYYMTGSVDNVLTDVDGTRDDQTLTMDILDDFIQLHANQNLIIIVCHRIEILNTFDNTKDAIDRGTLNQLNKLLDRIKAKNPLELFPVNFLSKITINSGIKKLQRAISSLDVEEVMASEIDMEEVRPMLQRIKH